MPGARGAERLAATRGTQVRLPREIGSSVQAKLSDSEELYGLLLEAPAWLRAKGLRQWNPEYPLHARQYSGEASSKSAKRALYCALERVQRPGHGAGIPTSSSSSADIPGNSRRSRYRSMRSVMSIRTR